MTMMMMVNHLCLHLLKETARRMRITLGTRRKLKASTRETSSTLSPRTILFITSTTLSLVPKSGMTSPTKSRKPDSKMPVPGTRLLRSKRIGRRRSRLKLHASRRTGRTLSASRN